MVRGISEDGSTLIFRVKQSKKTGLITIYHTTWLYIPEDFNPQQHYCENLISKLHCCGAPVVHLEQQICVLSRENRTVLSLCL